VYLLAFHAYINEMHGSRCKIPSKKSRPYTYIKFLALLGAPYIYDISRLRVKVRKHPFIPDVTTEEPKHTFTSNIARNYYNRNQNRERETE
jgi:hypothetical protein